MIEIKGRKLKDNIFIIITQLALSFLFGRVTVEWFLLSRFNSDFSHIYLLMWRSSGTIASSLLIIWLDKWYRNINKSILININNNSKIIKGKLYTLLFILYSFCIIYLFITLIAIAYKLTLNTNSIYYILTQCMRFSLEFIFNYLYIYIFLNIILCFKFITRFIRYLGYLLFIIIINNMWHPINLFKDNIYTNLITESNPSELYSFYIICSFYILYNLLIVLWENHISNNSLSDWKTNIISNDSYYHIFYIFLSVIMILMYVIGIYN